METILQAAPIVKLYTFAMILILAFLLATTFLLSLGIYWWKRRNPEEEEELETLEE